MTTTAPEPTIPVNPADILSMVEALDRNGDHDLALVVKQKFPELFPSDA